MPVFDTSFLVDAKLHPDWGDPIIDHAVDIGEPLLVPAQAAIEFAAGTDAPERAVTDLDSSFRLVPVDEGITREAAALAKEAHQDGVFPGWADIQVAATANHHGLSVVTTNPGDFEDLHVGVWNLPDRPSSG